MVAARAAKGGLKLWLSDPATYPIIAIITCAITGGCFTIARYSTQHPDVRFNKQSREDLFRFNAEDGANWRSHRFTLANAKRNPINQSEQFDDLFKKPENQHITR